METGGPRSVAAVRSRECLGAVGERTLFLRTADTEVGPPDPAAAKKTLARSAGERLAKGGARTDQPRLRRLFGDSERVRNLAHALFVPIPRAENRLHPLRQTGQHQFHRRRDVRPLQRGLRQFPARQIVDSSTGIKSITPASRRGVISGFGGSINVTSAPSAGNSATVTAVNPTMCIDDEIYDDALANYVAAGCLAEDSDDTQNQARADACMQTFYKLLMG